ncbi:hypothetical protein L208DRAFT_1380934 [Tricholoma matsutake]|nr:hypothetical protein L208DRAFT_1380934 [Tricholoma matsutake 945]
MSRPPPKEAAVKKGSKKKASDASGEGDEGDRKRHKATISEPPAQLKLDVSHQRSAKKTLVVKVDVAPSSSEPPAWIQPLMMMFGVQALQFQGLCHTPAAAPMEPQPIPQQPAVVPAPALLPTSQVPSTPAALTLKWSAEFDIEPEDSLEFVSWLEAHGLLEVNDLLDLTPDKLAELGGMAWGTTNHILKFAVTNYQKIVEHTKRIRLN